MLNRYHRAECNLYQLKILVIGFPQTYSSNRICTWFLFFLRPAAHMVTVFSPNLKVLYQRRVFWVHYSASISPHKTTAKNLAQWLFVPFRIILESGRRNGSLHSLQSFFRTTQYRQWENNTFLDEASHQIFHIFQERSPIYMKFRFSFCINEDGNSHTWTPWLRTGFNTRSATYCAKVTASVKPMIILFPVKSLSGVTTVK